MSGERAGAPQFIRGVPHPLPAGETVLWEGAPTAGALATHVFHWRFLAGYFAVMLTIWVATTDLAVSSDAFRAGLLLRLSLVAAVMGIIVMLSRVVARTTWYAITSQRLVLRIGMVFPMSINVPFSIVESASVGQFKDGTGQVALRLNKGNRLAYVALWPHCRVFALTQPEPLLRALPNAATVGGILAQAVAESAAASGAAPASPAPELSRMGANVTFHGSQTAGIS